MTPIDAAINDLLTEIGDGWYLESIDSQRISTTTVGEQVQGKESFVMGWYRAALVHRDGVMVMGKASTPGGALAEAALKVIRLRSDRG